MTEEELKEMSAGGIPVPQDTISLESQVNPQPVSVPNEYQYFRRCPTCGHMEMVNTPAIQPFSQDPVSPPPVKNSPDKISVLNNGQNLEDGGVEAEWR